MRAGAADGADAQPFGRDRVQLAVAMTRNKDLGAVLFELDKGHQKMLSVPHRQYDRQVRPHLLVDIGRLDLKTRSVPNKTQIFRRGDADAFLHAARASDPSPG